MKPPCNKTTLAIGGREVNITVSYFNGSTLSAFTSSVICPHAVLFLLLLSGFGIHKKCLEMFFISF